MATRRRVAKKAAAKAPPVVEAEPKEEVKVKVEEIKAEVEEPKTENGEAKEEVKKEVEEEEAVEAEGEEGDEMTDEDAEKLLEGDDEEMQDKEEEEEKGEEEKTETEEGKEDDKKEEEGDKEETEEDKKNDEKAAEKKVEEKKKTYIPSAGKYNQDEHVYMRLRSVVVGPLELEDLQNDIVKDMAKKSEEFFYRFHFIEKDDKHVGHIEFRFKSITEADKMIETLKTIKEGIVVKRLIGGMNAAKFDKDVRGINDDSEKEKYKRIVAVGGVPESATMEKLQEVFPDARVKFIALKPDGTPKWYAYLELADEEAAKKYADSHKEVEYEGEKLYCRCLRPGKPEEIDFDRDPDRVMSDEERRKLQARINTMKYKLNGGAVLRPLDAQRLRRRVSQLQSLLRANQKRKAQAGPSGEKTESKTPVKTPGTTDKPFIPGNRRGGPSGMRNTRGNMRSPRGGNQSAMRGRFGPSGPGFQQRMQGGMGPMGGGGMPRQGFYGGGRGGRSPGAVQQGGQMQGQGQGQGQGRNNMYNNPRQTANAVNMLVGLTNLLSQARNQGGNQGNERGGGNQGSGGFRGNNQGGGYSGGGYSGNDNFNEGDRGFNNYGGNFNNSGYNQGGGGFGQGGGNYGNSSYSGGGGGYGQGGNYGGNFNRKRTYSNSRRGGGPPNKQGRRFGGNWN